MKSAAMPSHGLLFVVGCYVALYGGLLWYTNGLPYVFDNNESFSSLWHAYNLYHFDIARSMGLADESFSYHAAAHPFVHTHQGNLPRFFAFVIFVLGATTVQSQIVVTTFTVGLVAVLMAYLFIRRTGDELLAVIFCVLLMSDYILVTQWQVVTYRVWHMLFAFSSLLCVHLIARNRPLGVAVTILNFAGLFYYELVFVFFVTVSAAIYAAIRLRTRDVFAFWASQALGAVLSLSVLLIQLALYMGWDNTLTDFRLTFLSRNYLTSLGETVIDARSFYEQHHIAFWYNLQDGAQYRSIQALLGSLTHFELQVHTPFFVTCCLILLGGLYMGAVVRRYDSNSRAARVERLESQPIVVSAPYLWSMLVGVVGLYAAQCRGKFDVQHFIAVFVLGASVVAAVLARSRQFRSAPAPGRPARPTRSRAVWWLAMAVSLGCLPAAVSHESLSPILFDRYSLFYVAYLLLYLFLTAWIALNALNPRFLTHGVQVIQRILGRMPSSVAYGVLTLCCCVFASIALDIDMVLGISADLGSLRFFIPETILLGCALAFVLAIMATQPVEHRAPEVRSSVRIRVLTIAGYMLLAAVIVGLDASVFNLYDHRFGPFWRETALTLLPGPLVTVLLCAVVIVVSAIALGSRMFEPEARCASMLRKLWPFVIAGLAAYLVTFFLAPAYIFTGYRYRYAPFTVFHTTALTTIAAYPLVLVAVRAMRIVRESIARHGWAYLGRTFSERGGSIGTRYVASFRALCMLVAVGLGYYWIGMQMRYVELIPPRHFSFLEVLAKAPLRGATFVVGGYAAPIAAMTGNWAYLDEDLLSNAPILSDDGRNLLLGGKYVWFADAKQNPEYRRPAYFVCITLQSFPSMTEVAAKRTGLGNGWQGCEGHALVRIARGLEPALANPAVTLVDVDRDGPERIGFERWAVIGLNWQTAGGRP